MSGTEPQLRGIDGELQVAQDQVNQVHQGVALKLAEILTLDRAAQDFLQSQVQEQQVTYAGILATAGQGSPRLFPCRRDRVGQVPHLWRSLPKGQEGIELLLPS